MLTYLLVYISRFREGLRTLGLFEQVQMCAESFYSVFCGPVERLTAESVMELFTARFSEEKEQQAKENTTIHYWKQFLQECDGMFAEKMFLYCMLVEFRFLCIS